MKTFNDVNQNRWKDTGEQSLAGIKIRLADKSGKGQEIATEAPTCFNDLSNGTFIIAAVPPKDYGLTTPPQLQVQVTSGQQLVLEFGAAKGYQPVQSSLDKVEATATPPMQAVKPASIPEIVAGNTGLIVLAVAGLLFVGGMSVAFLVRRT